MARQRVVDAIASAALFDAIILNAVSSSSLVGSRSVPVGLHDSSKSAQATLLNTLADVAVEVPEVGIFRTFRAEEG